MHSILAARTDFSLGESILTTEKLITEAQNQGAKAAMITDTMSVTAMINFTKQAKAVGIKPIIGVRLRLTDNPLWRPEKGEKKADMPKAHFLTLVARTKAGMQAIFRLLSLGADEAHFYYFAKLGFDEFYRELASANRDDLSVILGDTDSVLTHPDIDNIIHKVKQHVNLVFAPIILDAAPYFGRMNELALYHA